MQLTPHQARVEVLRLIALHDGAWSWYQLDPALNVTRLPAGYRLNHVLHDLESAGYIRSERTDGPSRLHMTDEGRTWLSTSGSGARRRSIERIREMLAAQVGPGFQVSKRLENHFFEDGLAAEADITVRHDGRILLAVVEDSVPRDRDAVIRLWQRFSAEVWVVDLRAQVVIAARQNEPTQVAASGDHLSTSLAPGLVIDVRDLFG